MPKFNILHCEPHGILNFNNNYLLKGYIFLNIWKTIRHIVYPHGSVLFSPFANYLDSIDLNPEALGIYMAKLLKVDGRDASYMIRVWLMESFKVMKVERNQLTEMWEDIQEDHIEAMWIY